MISKSVSKWFRGLAILMVIASHYAVWMFEEPVNPGAREWFMTLGVYGVDIFFMLSGYGLVKSASKNGINRRFVWNRFSSSYLPYFVLIGTLMLMDGNPVTVEGILNFLTGYDFWFMANIFVFYLLFMIFWKIRFLRNLLLIIGIAVYTWYLYTTGRNDFWYVSNMAFVVGVLFAETEERDFAFFDKWFSQVVLLLASFLGMRWCYKQYVVSAEISWKISTGIFFTVFMMTVCILISMVGKRMGENKFLKIVLLNGVMGLLGTYSVFIYLLHTRLFYSIIVKLDETLGYRKQVIIVGCITLVTTILLGFCFTKLVDGLTKLAENRSARNKAAKQTQ